MKFGLVTPIQSARIVLLTIVVSLAPPSLAAQTQVTAAVVNGVLNPTQFSGSDIGQQGNAAWASGLGKTVRIPAGSYSLQAARPAPCMNPNCNTSTASKPNQNRKIKRAQVRSHADTYAQR
jgi:hypothetical protein